MVPTVAIHCIMRPPWICPGAPACSGNTHWTISVTVSLIVSMWSAPGRRKSFICLSCGPSQVQRGPPSGSARWREGRSSRPWWRGGPAGRALARGERVEQEMGVAPIDASLEVRQVVAPALRGVECGIAGLDSRPHGDAGGAEGDTNRLDDTRGLEPDGTVGHERGHHRLAN